MANVTTFNPIKVDTVGSILTTPATIKAILWVSNDTTDKDIAADDDMETLDKSGGNLIRSKRAEAVTDSLQISFSNGLHVQGIYVSKLDGGILLIYI